MTHPISFSEGWQVLQIAQTTDVALIRRAYAARLKQFRPDDDPQGFQRLRTAYEAALEWARRQPQDGDDAAETIDRTQTITSTTTDEADTHACPVPADNATLPTGTAPDAAKADTAKAEAANIFQQAQRVFGDWLNSLPEDVWQYSRDAMGDLATGNDLRIVDSLTGLRLTPQFVQLEFADAFEYHAMCFTAQPNAAPAIRMVLADAYAWEDNFRNACRFGYELANEAIWRTAADNALAKFVRGRGQSPAKAQLLADRRPGPVWRPIDSGLLGDMRKVLASLDGELRIVRDMAFDRGLIDAWRQAVLQPRVTHAGIVYIALFCLTLIVLGAAYIKADPDSAWLMTYLRADEARAGILVLGGGLLLVAALTAAALGLTNLFGAKIKGRLQALCAAWERGVTRHSWINFGWYGLATLTGVVSILGDFADWRATPTLVAALSVMGAAWALIVSIPLIVRSFIPVVGVSLIYAVVTTVVWISLANHNNDWEIINCWTIAFGATRLFPVVRIWLQRKHESAHAWALGLTIAVGCIGVDVAYLLDWAMPVWLVLGFWLWCALVNLQVTVFFSGLAPHWFLYYPLWVVAGTGISIASKTLPPAYAAIIGMMLFAMITLLLTLWGLWSARQDLRRVPSR